MLPIDQPPRDSAVLHTTTYTFPTGHQIVYKQGHCIWHLAGVRQLQVVCGICRPKELGCRPCLLGTEETRETELIICHKVIPLQFVIDCTCA